MRLSARVVSLAISEHSNRLFTITNLNLTKEQTKQLEYVQWRALKVILGNIPYDEVRRTHDIPTLAERRLDLIAEHFSRGSSETTRMSSGISCQPSVMFNLYGSTALC